MTSRLAEIYSRDGYVVPDFRLPQPVLGKLQELTLEIVEKYPHLADAPINSPHVHYDSRLRLRLPHTKEWMEIASHPGLLDVAEEIIGPDIIMWCTTLFYKRPQGGPATGWHRDGPFWPIKPLTTTTIWISIFESRIDNGCLRFIPGSHLDKDMGHHFHDNSPDVTTPITISRDAYDELKARNVELEPGQMVVFDVRSIHGAEKNLGTRQRAGFSIRMIPSTSHYDHDMTKVRRELDEQYERKERDKDYAARPLFLVRGADRCGLNDFKRGHLKPENV